MAVRHVLENLTVDWETLGGPSRDAAVSHPAEPSGGRKSGPFLGTFRAPDLRSVPSLLALYRDAVSRGLIDRSEDGLLAFLSTAAYALRVGHSPPGLFVHLLRAGRLPAAVGDEVRAVRALKKHRAATEASARWLKECSQDGPRPASRSHPGRGLSRDAALLEATRAELERRGLSGRLFAALHQAGWDKARFKAALAELENCHPTPKKPG